MKTYKRVLCIFLSVVILFFGVNNSYFSPHKMDTVEAGAITATVAISAELVIELMCAIVASGLAVGLIVEWTDMDFEAILVDLHNWLQDNIGVLDTIGIDGTSALKEWAEADSWTVVEGSGGSAPEPSPGGDDKGNFLDKVWGASTTWTIGNLIAMGTIKGKEFLNQVVPMTKEYMNLAKEYIGDKITNFKTADTVAGKDPITDALKYRFPNSSLTGYDGDLEVDANGNYHYISSIGNYNGSNLSLNFSSSSKIYGILAEGDTVMFHYKQINFSQPLTFQLGDGSTKILQQFQLETIWDDGTTVLCPFSSNFPIFSSKADALRWLDGDSDVRILNRKNNYIDTNDDYGWASTANLSPADLAALGFPINPMLLNGVEVSIAALAEAVSALKSQLEEMNPNRNPDGTPILNPDGSPALTVPYPDVPTYIDIWENIMRDPSIFPEAETNPGTGGDKPNPSPKPSPSAPPEEGGNTDKNKWVVDLSKFFPFCIPFDLIHLLNVLDAKPVAPRWELPLKAPAFGIDYTFVIDMSEFEDLAEIFRYGETLLYVLGLILLTRNIIKG